VNFSLASASASRSQSFGLARAMGTKYFMATCAPISPQRTRSWIDSANSFTNPSRRDTQLKLRSKR
jgi:hypothetical protein